MLKTITIIGIICFITLFGVAQDVDNLVENPGFEIADKIKKLKGLKKIEIANGWNSPTVMRADLYSTQSKEIATIPNNKYGREFPIEGKEGNYAGIVAYSYNNREPRTYLQTELKESLKKGVEYCIKYHVSLSDLSKYGVNNLGVYLSKEALEKETKEDIIFQKEKELAKVVIPKDNETKVIRYGFEPICGVYEASGKEKYLVIGNFKNNKATKYEKLKVKKDVKGTQLPKAYYYVDQVEVFVLEDPEDCDCSQKSKSEQESVIYHKQFTSEDGFTIAQQVKFSTIYFDNRSANIDRIMVDDLDNLANILQENKEIKVEINAHVDKEEIKAGEKEPDNEELKNIDKKRSEAVKSYLMKKGVDENRLTIKNNEALQPASDGETEIDKAKNRRVEFVIVE